MKDIELYNKAKETYYNGIEIMSDYEFDELERSLGLENKSYIGSRHNPSYTVKHPFIMGSLSKVQVKENNKGEIDWVNYYNDAKSYINKYCRDTKFIVTPKYDGCSFECVIKNNEIVSISSRGDGDYGKDLKKHLYNKLKNSIDDLNKNINTDYVIRGEVLVDLSVFSDKYQDKFVNPRSFVSGILGRDYCDDKDFLNMLDDLKTVIYDIRLYNGNTYNDTDFTNYNYECKPSYYEITNIENENDFKNIYNRFDTYRKTQSSYALDGIVIKPIDKNRQQQNKPRPEDCVAIKFVPMLQETEVTDIVWATSKTNELIPTVWFKTIVMDGKKVTKASGHNYGYLKANKISIGTKLIISLAGDIIPFIYKITNTENYSEDKLNIPSENTEIDGCHLYKIYSDEERKFKSFINSIASLNIPGFGGANATKLYEYICDEYKGNDFFEIEEREVPDNILLINAIDIERGIGGKNGQKIRKEFEKLLINITIKDIIKSLSIPDCGTKIIDQIENYFLNKETDFSHLNRNGYSWIYDKSSYSYIRLTNIMNYLNKSFDDFKVTYENSENTDIQNRIPVILTGEPNNYKSKAEFLQCNPQYKLTTSWKECKIVFTNSLESRTGKMKKAIEKNIDIKLY